MHTYIHFLGIKMHTNLINTNIHSYIHTYIQCILKMLAHIRIHYLGGRVLAALEYANMNAPADGITA